MIEWGNVPWTIWVYVVMGLGQSALSFALWSGPKIGYFAISMVILAVWDYFLLRRVRWLWIVTVGLYVLILAQYLAVGPRNFNIGVTVITIGLLLHPLTRGSFVDREEADLGIAASR